MAPLVVRIICRSGSAVLTDRSALSLSWPVYQNVSTALAVSSSLTDCQSLNVKLVLDLEYLATFLARVPRLELYQGPGSQTEFPGLIHLAGLDQLRAVTFTKLPVHLIQDLVRVRESLESLALHRCAFTLDSLVSQNTENTENTEITENTENTENMSSPLSSSDLLLSRLGPLSLHLD